MPPNLFSTFLCHALLSGRLTSIDCIRESLTFWFTVGCGQRKAPARDTRAEVRVFTSKFPPWLAQVQTVVVILYATVAVRGSFPFWEAQDLTRASQQVKVPFSFRPNASNHFQLLLVSGCLMIPCWLPNSCRQVLCYFSQTSLSMPSVFCPDPEIHDLCPGSFYNSYWRTNMTIEPKALIGDGNVSYLDPADSHWHLRFVHITIT